MVASILSRYEKSGDVESAVLRGAFTLVPFKLVDAMSKEAWTWDSLCMMLGMDPIEGPRDNPITNGAHARNLVVSWAANWCRATRERRGTNVQGLS